MTLPKFIITMDGYFRLGMVNMHKDLLKPGDECIGGGYYYIDYTSNRIILDRASYDYGRLTGICWKRSKCLRLIGVCASSISMMITSMMISTLAMNSR